MEIKNIFDFPITKEQEDVILAASNDVLLIDAVAGAAKTSTCQLIAANYVEETLYMAYNKMMADDASMKFPSHVQCITTHALAYRAIGHKYKGKLSRPKGRYVPMNYTVKEVSRLFKLSDIDFSGLVVQSNRISDLIINTVNKFEYSDSNCVSLDNFPKNQCIDFLVKIHKKAAESIGILNVDVQKVCEDICDFVLPKARDLWLKRADINDVTMITHDTYLKIFQLSKPKLGYKRVILDEAQDTNPCVMDLFLCQKPESKLVAVGDRRQQIYKWRGAVNALDKIDGHRLNLTQSFRYGQRVADVAMGILSGSVKIKGFDKLDTSVVSSNSVGHAGCAFIYRGNASIIIDGIMMMKKGANVFLNIDVYDMVKLMKSMVCLMNGDSKGVTHQKALSFIDFDDAMVESKKDKELSRIIKIITKGLRVSEDYTLSYIDVIDILSEYKKPNMYDVFMTTAHKSKGLEFDYVVLGDDFLNESTSISDDGNEIKNEQFYSEEFRNLCYVASTRARYGLAINSSISKQLIEFIDDGAIRHKDLRCRISELMESMA